MKREFCDYCGKETTDIGVLDISVGYDGEKKAIDNARGTERFIACSKYCGANYIMRKIKFKEFFSIRRPSRRVVK